MTATSQHTENREDPGAGEDSPPLPCGALRVFFPLAPAVGHRDEGPERPWSCGSLARAVSVGGSASGWGVGERENPPWGQCERGASHPGVAEGHECREADPA